MDRTTYNKILNEFTAISDLKTANGLNNTKQFESEIEKVLKPLIESGNVLRRVQYDKGEGLRKVKYAYDASSEVQKTVSAALQAVQNNIIPSLNHDPENPGKLLNKETGDASNAPLYIDQYDSQAFEKSKEAMLKEKGVIASKDIVRKPIRRKYDVTSERILDPKARAYVQKSIVESGGSFSTNKATGVSTYTAPSGRASDVTRLTEFVDATDTKYLKGLSSASALAEGASPATVEERSKASLLRQMRIREASAKAVEDELQNDPDNPQLIMRALAEKDAVNRVQKRQLRQEGNNPYSVAFSDNVQAGLRKSEMRKQITDDWLEDNPTSYLAKSVNAAQRREDRNNPASASFADKVAFDIRKSEMRQQITNDWVKENPDSVLAKKLSSAQARQESMNPYSDAFSNKISSSLASSDMKKKLTAEWMRANPTSELAMRAKEVDENRDDREKSALSKKRAKGASGITDMISGTISGAIGVLVTAAHTIASTLIKIFSAVTKIMDSTQKVALGSSALNIDSPTLRGYEVMAGKMGFGKEPKKFETIFRGTTNALSDMYSTSYASAVSSLAKYVPSTVEGTLSLAQGGAKNAIPIMNRTMAAFATNVINGRRGEADVNGSLDTGQAKALASTVIEGSFLGSAGSDVFNRVMMKMEETGFLKGKTSISASDWDSFTTQHFGTTPSDIIMSQPKQDIIINIKEQFDAATASFMLVIEDVVSTLAIHLKSLIPVISDLSLFILRFTNPHLAAEIVAENKAKAGVIRDTIGDKIQEMKPLNTLLLENAGVTSEKDLAPRIRKFLASPTDANAKEQLGVTLEEALKNAPLYASILALDDAKEVNRGLTESGKTPTPYNQGTIDFTVASIAQQMYAGALKNTYAGTYSHGKVLFSKNDSITQAFSELKSDTFDKSDGYTYAGWKVYATLQDKIKKGDTVKAPLETYLDGFSTEDLSNLMTMLRATTATDANGRPSSLTEGYAASEVLNNYLTARAVLSSTGVPLHTQAQVNSFGVSPVQSDYMDLRDFIESSTGSVIQSFTGAKGKEGSVNVTVTIKDDKGNTRTVEVTEAQLRKYNLAAELSDKLGELVFLGANSSTPNGGTE